MIPLGGSNSIGTWGYIEAFREMLNQVMKQQCSALKLPRELGNS